MPTVVATVRLSVDGVIIMTHVASCAANLRIQLDRQRVVYDVAAAHRSARQSPYRPPTLTGASDPDERVRLSDYKLKCFAGRLAGHKASPMMIPLSSLSHVRRDLSFRRSVSIIEESNKL